MEIQKATSNNAKAIANLLVKSWRHAYKGIMPDNVLESLSVEKRAEGWKKHLESGAEVYALVDDGKIIGVLEISQFRENLSQYKHYAEIPVIYLLPDKIGQGVGYKLIRFAMDLLNTRGINNIAVWVLEKNLPAARFYERAGFVNSGEVKEFRDSGLTEHLYINNSLQRATSCNN